MTLLQSKLVHFFYLFFYSIAGLMGATSQYFEITGSGPDRFLSIQSAFTALQSKRSADQIAADLLDSAMPRKTYAQQEALINAYNERLRKRQEENQKLSAQGLSPVRTGEDYASKLLARKAAEAEAATAEMQQKLQADMQRLEQEREEERLAYQEKLQRAEEERQAAKEKASLFSPMKAKLAAASTEIERLKSQPVGLGGGSARPIDQLVATISLAKNITIKEMIFNDAAFTVAVHINLNGQDVTYQVDGMDSEEYDRLKIFLALSARMHSKTFNAASGAVSDLLTDILSSSAPQAYHLKQTAQLAATTSRLDEFLNYHIALQQKLTGLAALPLSNFLAIRFLSTDAVEFTRSQVLGEFKAIHDQIPLQDELALGSQALDKFLKKIASSIELPTEIEFSTKEIEDIFKELGLLLETDSDGIVIDSEYYNQLLEFSEKFTALKKAMLSKNEELYESALVKAALKAIEESILAANPALPSNFEQICAGFNDLINIGIASKGLQKTLGELQTIADRSFNMPLQDAGLATAALKTGGADVVPIQAVLFLLQTFAKDQLDIVKKFSIVGNLDPAIQAACSAYYRHDLQAIRQTLLKSSGFAFNEGKYKKLKSSENVAFIKLYLESITTGVPIVVNLDELKERTLGIQSSIEAKRKTVLILRVSDLLYSSAFQPKLSVEEATAISERSADFDNPAIADAVLQYELQDNTLKTERDKKKFLDSYLNVRLASTDSASASPEVSHEEKVRRLKQFFARSLASTAKDVDLVKLVLTLPTLKRDYQASFDKFIEVVNGFNSVYASGSSSSSASNTRISALCKAFADIDSDCTGDERLVLKRTLDKLLQLQEISQKFLTVGNSTGAMVGTGDSLLQDSSFPVTAGISQLEFDTVLQNAKYNVFYNAVKILHFIALAMPSADDFSLIEELMLAKIPPEESEKKEQLKQLLIDVIKMANEMRQQSTEFYGQITALMQFVNNFEQQKNKYNESSGEECINFHETLDTLSGTKPKPAVLAVVVAAASVPKLPVGGGVVEEQPKVERVYEDSELGQLSNIMARGLYKKLRNENKTAAEIRAALTEKYPDLEIEPKYTGGSVVTVAASAPNLVAGGEVNAQPKVERVYTDDEIETLGACKAAYKKQLGLGLSPDAIRAKIKSIMQLEIEPKYTGGSVVTVAASAPKLPVAGGLLAGIVGRGSALNLGGSKPVEGVASLFAPKPPVAGGLIDGIGERGKKTGLEAPLANDGTPADNGMQKQHRVEEQLKVERVYEDSELGQLSNVMARGMYKRLRNEGNTAAAAIRAALTEKYPDLEIEPKYTGGSVVTVAASAPKLPVGGGLSALFGAKPPVAGGGMLAALGANQPKFIYAKLSPMRSLVTWLNKDDKKLKEEIAGELAKARSSNMSDTSVLINAFYEPLMQMQIAYLQQVDFSKLEKEEDAFYLVRQVLSTVDLYLRIKRHEKLFSGVALNVASKNERKKFEDECFSQKNYTIFHIIKAFKTPVSLNANQTNDLLVRIKTGHSDLKRLIGNTIIEAFEAGSINIIDPVITAIESY